MLSEFAPAPRSLAAASASARGQQKQLGHERGLISRGDPHNYCIVEEVEIDQQVLFVRGWVMGKVLDPCLAEIIASPLQAFEAEAEDPPRGLRMGGMQVRRVVQGGLRCCADRAQIAFVSAFASGTYVFDMDQIIQTCQQRMFLTSRLGRYDVHAAGQAGVRMDGSCISSFSGAKDPRTELAQAQAPVGLLQLPRTRGERLRHLEILDQVPFDLVNAYHEREAERGQLVGAARGPIGKILRRHRQDDSTTLIRTMLKACVEKRWDPMLWDTFAEAVQTEQNRLTPSDISLVLFCFMKADYRRDASLVPELLKILASFAVMPAASPRSAPGHASNTLATVATAALPTSGRKHRRKSVQPGALKARPGGGRPAKKASFPEYALLASFAAAQNFSLGKASGDDLAKLCGRALQSSSELSGRVLCRLVHHSGSLIQATGGCGPALKLLLGMQQELRQRLLAQQAGADAAISASDLCLVAHAYAQIPQRADKGLFQEIEKRLLDDASLIEPRA
ncbi:unnamed protein product [Symbiodinium sp. CCMP2592]|nr:unnamed protein product [Symbiodinium sp. CCMP2592]